MMKITEKTCEAHNKPGILELLKSLLEFHAVLAGLWPLFYFAPAYRFFFRRACQAHLPSKVENVLARTCADFSKEMRNREAPMPHPSTIRTEILGEASDFVRLWPQIETLRRQLDVDQDVLVNPLHFLATTDETRRPCSVACWQGSELMGLLYATEHCVRGYRTGYAIAGDFVGRGALLCRSEDQDEVVQAAVEKLLSTRVHSLHLRTTQSESGGLTFNRMTRRASVLEALIPGDRMVLPANYNDFLTTLGKHTRRNIRYYTRRAAARGICFASGISRDEYQAGVDRLNAKSSFPAGALHLARDERLMALHGGGRRFGLRAADGTLVSVLCGFTRGTRFHLLTQLNDTRFESLSLSIVLRGRTVEDLIRSGHDSLQFMGGAALSLSRFCTPIAYRSLFIDRRFGAFAAIKFATSSWVKLSQLRKKSVPDFLASLSSGFLGEANLTARTMIAVSSVFKTDSSKADASIPESVELPAASPPRITRHHIQPDQFAKPPRTVPFPIAATPESDDWDVLQ